MSRWAEGGGLKKSLSMPGPLLPRLDLLALNSEATLLIVLLFDCVRCGERGL